MKINSNIQALLANHVLKTNEEKNAASTEKLSSGFKINHAKDSPAGMAVANRMNAQIRSLNKAKDNSSNAVNVVQTADGALTEVHSMLQRMNELAVKASTGTLTASDRDAIQEEVSALSKEINRIASDTEYNTQNLLGGEQEMKGYVNTTAGTDPHVKVIGYDPDFPAGEYEIKYTTSGTGEVTAQLTKDGKDIPTECKDGRTVSTLPDGSQIVFKYDDSVNTTETLKVDVTGIGGMKIQVGSASGREIQVVIPKMDTETMGIDEIDLRTAEGARDALEKIKGAIEYTSKSRSTLGAYQNRLESTVAALAETIENLESSYSTLKDVDMAEEMVEYTKLQVLVQAGTSMLAQANEQPQQALTLLQ